MLVSHHDRRVRPGHPQRQHADRRPRRRVRPEPAAPAARAGRPRPGARLRLLPVPAGEAADPDRPRPAGHDRRAHRPRRGHGGGDEGPGDPRRGQPARRRAVRAHRRRRLRPVRAAGRRGAGRVPRRRRAPSLADVKVELPVDAHIPHDYVTGERLRLEAYRRIAAATDDAAIAEVVAELRDRYGPLPEPVERLMDVARLRGPGPLGRGQRDRPGRQLRALRRRRPARVAHGCACCGCTRAPRSSR